MRLVWGLVAAIGLLVGAGLACERFTPPEQATRPATPYEAILTGGTAQPVLASEPAPSAPTRLPPAAPARRAPSVNLAQPDSASGPVLTQPAEPSAVEVRAEAPPALATVTTGARPTAAVAGRARDEVARPHPIRPKVDAPRVSAPTPTPCVLEPPPRYLDAAPRAPEK